MSLVGIIANPASGKDIRRLVAHGSVFGNPEKVRVVRRVLLGLAAVGVDRICYMPDYFSIVERAMESIEIDTPIYSPAGFALNGNQDDSTQAAGLMERQGVDCIITLGGDGTNRVVAKGAATVPILPVSTGTNNVFSSMIEGTTAGLAAAIVANHLVPLEESTYTSTKLEVVVDGKPIDLALVDAVLCDDLFAASKAVWEPDKIRQIFLNRAQPYSIGFSAIGGLLQPIAANEPIGLNLELGDGGRPLTAPLAPGMIRTVFIKSRKIMRVGETHDIRFSPGILALDGEREVEVREGRKLAVRIATDGPIVVDAAKTMLAAMKRQILTRDYSEGRAVRLAARK